MVNFRYIVSRSIQTVVLLWAVLSLLFLLTKMMPGSFADIMTQQGASPEAMEAFREKWALDQPIYVQYWVYIEKFVFELNPGNSVRTGTPVIDLVAQKIFNTFILVAPGITIGYLLGTIGGTIMGFKRGSKIEKSGVGLALAAGSFPSYFTSILLILFFARYMNFFPVGGLVSIETQMSVKSDWGVYLTMDFLKHYILPLTAVVIRYIRTPSILMRTSVVEVVDLGFMDYHKLTGVPPAGRIRRLLRHAILPVLTMYPLSMARALSGLVLIESVFAWPGIGAELVRSITNRDFPVVIFILFITAAFIIISNFVVDILYSQVDPRITLGEEQST